MTEERKFYHAETNYLGEDEVVSHILLPKEGKTPQILCWAGPGRCGSTALLLLMAGVEEINRGYYQPLKTIIRYGGPDFQLYGDDGLVVTKEVFGPRVDQEYYDPVRILLKAGVPLENIRIIMMLRDPIVSFASWYHFTGNDSNPERFAQAQQHTIKLYQNYLEIGITVVPFVYELLEMGEINILKALFKKLGVNFGLSSLNFDLNALGITAEGEMDLTNPGKMVWGEAAQPDHWNAVIKPTVLRGQYRYTRPQESRKVNSLPDELKREVERLCMTGYLNFLNLTKNYLGID